jgi:hypothetical protein
LAGVIAIETIAAVAVVVVVAELEEHAEILIISAIIKPAARQVNTNLAAFFNVVCPP